MDQYVFENMNECQQPEDLPKISVITPSYQQGEFLEVTIQSVISQDYPNLEFIVIDGGSADNSVDIIKKYDSNISYWVSEPDNGQTHALNKGFRKASGNIICWINSDDILFPDALLTVGKFFAEHPEIFMIYGGAYAIDHQGNPLHVRKPGPFNLKWLIRTDDIPQSSVFFRRDLLISIGYLDERLHYAMDYDLLMKSALKQEPTYIPKTLSGFRIYPKTKTSEGKTQFSVDIVYFIGNTLRNYTLTDDRKIALLTTQFWRIFEIILAKESGSENLINLKNDPDVIKITQRYLDVLFPHFLDLMRLPFFFSGSRMQSILTNGMIDLLKQYPDCLSLSDEGDIKRLIRDQKLDIFIFSIRLWNVHKRMEAIRLFLNILISIPYLFANQQFWRILKTNIAP